MRDILFVALAALLLLSGCASVPQYRYDELKSACDAEIAACNADIAKEQAKSGTFEQKASDCVVAKQGLEALLARKDAECANYRKDSGILVAAREKTAEMARYNLTISYYNEIYGAGKIPNTQKLRTMENHLLLLNDQPLYAQWVAVMKCQGVSDCADSKAKFLGMINSSTTGLALEIADMVK